MATISRSTNLMGIMVLGLIVGLTGPAWAGAVQVWETTGFKSPESALYDAGRDVIYVSNINGGGLDRDGNGYISKVGPDGAVIEAEWATGLDAPKGMALHGGRLYVSDIDKLVEVEIESGKVVARHAAAGAEFLNDVTVDQNGQVYVSDMFTDTIYRLADGSFGVWLKSPALESPNGLVAEMDRLLVATWGIRTEGFETKSLGHLKAVSLDTKAVSSLGDGTPVGNLDGLEPDGKGRYLVTDWVAGGLFLVDPSGTAEKLLVLSQGSADLGFIAKKGLVLVPMMLDDKLIAFRLE